MAGTYQMLCVTVNYMQLILILYNYNGRGYGCVFFVSRSGKSCYSCTYEILG